MPASKDFTRRGFLMRAGSTVLSLSLVNLGCREQPEEAVERQAPPTKPETVEKIVAARPKVELVEYRTWEDLYRTQWAWDKVVKGTHFVNCWYQAHCAWNVYLKDGIVWREEQVGSYPQTNPHVPDPNPRGCQKGGCFSERMYDPTRVRYPLKRVGPRGSGKWKRLSWDEANREIADAILDTLARDGSDRVVWDLGPLYTEGTMAAGHQCLSVLLDSTNLDMNTEIGDGHRGVGETFGKIAFERSADDYFYSDLILIWGSNPIYTQIPNAHFLTEARYRGAQVVCIAPDYSASSIHADLFVPVKPGCDAALGLGVAHVLVEEGLVDEDFVVEQTDLALLVREDTRLFLRSSDLEQGGSEEELYLHDAARGVVKAPRRSLGLGDLKPDLEGRFEVTLRDGGMVGVRTVFSLLREKLADYDPERASRLCGTPPSLIRQLAERLARTEAASMVTSANMCKFYHGNLIERTQALVFALTGNYGKKGSGFVGFPWLDHDGLEGFIRGMFSLKDMMHSTALKIIGKTIADDVRWRLAGYSDEMILHETGRDIIFSGRLTSGALFWYVHGGLLEASQRLQEWDPYLKRPVREVLEESFEKGWQSVWPRPGDDPRVLFCLGSNPLRRIRCYPLLLEHLWPKLHTVVTLDWRMSSTALQSDYVLPAAGWYEHSEHKWVTPLMPYIHAGEKATTFYEARSDWEICSRLAEVLEGRAKERGMPSYVDRRGDERPLHNLYEKFSHGGDYGHTDNEKVCAALLEGASNVGGLQWEELREKGFARFESVGKSLVAVGLATDIAPGETITPLTRHVFGKEPYPTLSRRIQFYLDHELYLEMGEEMPTHKDPPLAGGNYPLTLSGGHARWSIHANWRDDRLMLQQQRGQPVVLMNPEDARERGIVDGAQVRVFNDLDEFQIMAKVTPALRREQVLIYHAWENFQFKGGKGFQNLIPSPLNPVELSGGQFHLRPMLIAMQPSHTDRDTRVDVAPA